MVGTNLIKQCLSELPITLSYSTIVVINSCTILIVEFDIIVAPEYSISTIYTSTPARQISPVVECMIPLIALIIVDERQELPEYTIVNSILLSSCLSERCAINRTEESSVEVLIGTTVNGILTRIVLSHQISSEGLK